MSISNSRLAYADCQEVFDIALEDPKGIRIPFDDFGACHAFRARLHKFRTIDREDNAKTFPREHPLHWRSNYDPVRARIIAYEEMWYLYLEPINDASKLTIERLSEVGPLEPRTVELSHFSLEAIHQRKHEPEPEPEPILPTPTPKLRRI
jgi:hypothetical protein